MTGLCKKQVLQANCKNLTHNQPQLFVQTIFNNPNSFKTTIFCIQISNKFSKNKEKNSNLK